MELPKAFWESQKGLLLVGENGKLRFTAKGRKFYTPLLAKYGFSISNVKTIEHFRDVMEVVNAGELDSNTRELMRLLNDPNTTPEEREAIKRVLSL